eukprot:TRINITY_DN1494_c0_g1_i1.p1 TRINITY_DN1494_c0_g1~~TRINITY_DN1494_c0_g1_i1.p1  ORF type:complete len:222 (-),score=1.34 TRINITY_DN1494_c0_g1_i1:70-735(-)
MKTALLLSLIVGVFVLYAMGDIVEIENNCNCGPNDRCCQDATLGAVCYNPNTHTCADNRKLCGVGEGVCINQCFNRKTHRCLTSAQGCKLCSVYDSLCGTTCYNPNLYRCSSGTVVPLTRTCSNGQQCAQGQLCCGLSFGSQTPICFNPTSETCCQSQLGDRTICPLSGGQRQSCCQQRSAIQCYNPNNQFCCATTTPFASVCPATNSTCCPAVNNIQTCY